MRDTILIMEKELLSHKTKVQYAESERKRLLEILDDSIASKEREVQLRVEFETKINGMYSLNRVLEEKYQRAIEDIGNLVNNLFKITYDTFLYKRSLNPNYFLYYVYSQRIILCKKFFYLLNN